MQILNRLRKREVGSVITGNISTDRGLSLEKLSLLLLAYENIEGR